MVANTFEPEARRMLLERKEGLKACLNDARNFINFLRRFDFAQLSSLIGRHNQKNPDVPLDANALEQELKTWQAASKSFKPRCKYKHETKAQEIHYPKN